jgi:ATP-dependent DNA helicase RecG
MGIDQKVTALKGVGAVVEQHLARLAISTVGDLLEHFPRRYEDRSRMRKISELVAGEFATFSAVVQRSELQRIRGKSIARVWVGDETGKAVLVWFNQPYRAKNWKNGTPLIIHGKAARFREVLQIESLEVDAEANQDSLNMARIVPIYPLTQGIGPRVLRKLIAEAIDCPVARRESMPQSVLQSYQLIPRHTALKEIHFPTDWAAMQRAKRRIVFEEFFTLQCALAYLRQQRVDERRGFVHAADGKLVQGLRQRLPFSLTDDQEQAFGEIRADMQRQRPMHRLLQGDVGSGKTAVALLALAKTVENGLQGIMMVPTEILAEQHFQSCADLLSGLGIRSALLTGRVKGKARSELLQQIQAGNVDVVIGTHALIQPDVNFSRVGLVVVDEQHRFGVAQRASLQEKGIAPHTLVMSATPIPRTMALTLYGDLDISTIRHLPPGRKPIVTAVRSGEAAREKVYQFLTTEVAAGRQGYVVCPLVEDSEKTEAQSATSIFIELTETMLKGIPCGLLHGRMSADEKERVMRSFVGGELAVLVSTTVIEVGINVPRATMMIVEDADRFGLAQLHQLRGRVGRGSERSYCVLLHDGAANAVPERLQVLAETGDGFIVAEKDLLLRGPGQFLGYRQHGLPEMKMASLADDLDILTAAREAGFRLMQDPVEAAQMLPLLQERFERFFGIMFAG